MKKLSIILFVIIFASVNVFCEDVSSIPRNGISFSFNDLLKTSLSSLFGNISYSRNLNDSFRINVGISGSYQTEADQFISKNSLLDESGIHGELSVIRISSNKNICPYIGLGIAGGLANASTTEKTVSGDQSYKNESLSLSGFIPFGVEIKIDNRFRIGILEKIVGNKVLNEKVIINTSGIESRESKTIYYVNASEPVLYFSIWF